MARQTSDEGPEEAAGLSRTTILILAGFMAGMTVGVSAPYVLFCTSVAAVSIVAYLALELTALRRARDRELIAQEEDPLPSSEGWSRREQRRSLRYSVPPEQQEATLKVGQAKIPVRLINISSGGFRVLSSRDPGVEIGQVVWIRTDAGWDEVRVVEAMPEGDGYSVRLQICSAAKPWNDVRDARSRQMRLRRSRLLVRLPLVCGVIAGIGVVLAPFIRNAFLNKSVPTASARAERDAKRSDPVKRPQSAAIQSVRSSAGVAVPGSPLPASGKRSADNRVPTPRVGESPGGLTGRGTAGASLPEAGDKRSRLDDPSSRVRSQLTEAIDTILRDVVEPTTVQRSGDHPGSAAVAPDRGIDSGSSRSVTGSDGGRSKALASFDRGLRRFWQSEYRQAVVAFKEATENWREDPTYYYFLALSHYLAGQRELAESVLATAVELESEHPAPELGRLLQRVQGSHRRWMQAARIKAQVGPYRPRR